jgi:hypothetical protein
MAIAAEGEEHENISRGKVSTKKFGRSPQAIENCRSERRRSLQRFPFAFDLFSTHVPEADFWLKSASESVVGHNFRFARHPLRNPKN